MDGCFVIFVLAAAACAVAVVVTLPYKLGHERRERRRARRLAAGQCVGCGYDLKGISYVADGCPECGTPIAPAVLVRRSRLADEWER